MRVLVTQPQFLPWIGFWNKMAMADVTVLYAGVQFVKNGDGNRVRTPQGWLTVPVFRNGHDTMICDVKINPYDLKKVVRSIEQQYMRKTDRYGYRLDELRSLLISWESPSLLDLQKATIEVVACALGIYKPIEVDAMIRTGDKVKKLEECLWRFGDVTLVSGAGGKGLGYEIIPNVNSVEYQHMLGPDKVSPHSILGLLVSVEDPLEKVRTAADWFSSPSK